MSYDNCSNYFRQKSAQWSKESPSQDFRDHISKVGKRGLVQEFRRDPEYDLLVCKFLAEYAEANERRSAISDILNESVFNNNATPAELELLVHAVLEACGHEKDNTWAWIVGGLLVLGGIIAAAALGGKGGRGR